MKARFARKCWRPRTAGIYVAATAGAPPNQPHEQLRRTKRYMRVLVAWPGVAVRPNASFIAGARASCSLNRRQARSRASVPPWRPARRPAARAPISNARAVGRALGPPLRAARSDARRLRPARAIDEGAFLPADAGDRARASSHSADRSRAGRPTTQAAAPNRALRGVSMASAASSRRPNASANAEPLGILDAIHQNERKRTAPPPC